MSANFLNHRGGMVGVDPHIYFSQGPMNVPLPGLAVYVVFAPHKYFSRSWRVAGSVTSDTSTMLQSGWAMLVVPHIPVAILPPHTGAQPIHCAYVTLMGSSAPTMSVHSVTGEGQALLTALTGFFGLNLDCGLPSLPSGFDFNPNSVKTTPTLGDYAAAVIGAILSSVWSAALSVGGWNLSVPWSIVITVVQNICDILSVTASWVFTPVATAINWVMAKVQVFIDTPRAVPVLMQ